MDIFIDILAEILCNLNFSNGFRDIRKKTKSKFLRGLLYVIHIAGMLLLAAAIAAVLFLLFELAGSVFGIFL